MQTADSCAAAALHLCTVAAWTMACFLVLVGGGWLGWLVGCVVRGYNVWEGSLCDTLHHEGIIIKTSRALAAGPLPVSKSWTASLELPVCMLGVVLPRDFSRWSLSVFVLRDSTCM
jgi:hypothetical protein